MEVVPLDIPEVRLIRPRRFEDSRGVFAEIYNERVMAGLLGLAGPLVQDNLSVSSRANTVRAFHFQRPPSAQGKLVRVVRGAIRDVAVDVRRGSASYGRHVSIDLSAARLELLWVPEGFAHGFATTEPETEVTFKTSAYYSPADEVGFLWNDPALGIHWGFPEEAAVISDRDRALPRLAQIDTTG